MHPCMLPDSCLFRSLKEVGKQPLPFTIVGRQGLSGFFKSRGAEGIPSAPEVYAHQRVCVQRQRLALGHQAEFPGLGILS